MPQHRKFYTRNIVGIDQTKQFRVQQRTKGKQDKENAKH